MTKPSCEKRSYGSAHAARRANRTARFRVKIYFCEQCHQYHCANLEKR